MCSGGRSRPPGDRVIVSEKTGQFAYFDAQLDAPRWRGARVLDFGGNCGNFLADAGDEIRAEDYWCLDVSAVALAEGKHRHPRAHWVHYDRHHARYNPHGRPHLPPPDLGRFDFILAYSVFTLLPEDEVRELVAALHRMLAPGGVLAFSFVDPEYRAFRKTRVMSNVEWRLDVAGHPDTAFLSAERVKRFFPGAEIREPTPEVRHHCCILGPQPNFSVLSKAQKSDIVREPFPHLVIEDALDADLYRDLAAAFPDGQLLRNGRTVESNRYAHYHANQILEDARVAALWRSFVTHHTSPAFYSEVLALFGDDIRETHPSLRLPVETSVRFAEEPRDIMLECQFAWCEPATSVSSSAPCHIDREVSLFFGLLYFRKEGDDSEGGDLELYRFRGDERAWDENSRVPPELVERVASIPYRANTLVFVVNSARSLHGVSPRSVTPWPRLHVNFVGELPQKVFER
jgi:SAM-dependent methyltransferase